MWGVGGRGGEREENSNRNDSSLWRRDFTDQVPRRLLVLLDAKHFGDLQQRVDVVGVELQQGLFTDRGLAVITADCGAFLRSDWSEGVGVNVSANKNPIDSY